MKYNLLFNNLLDQKYTLENGLTVILKSFNRLPVVSVQIWVKTGSIYETDNNNGISHFLEHLVFKGTKKYSVNQISKIIEKHGAILNAGTSKEFTIYYIDIPKEGLYDALDVLCELVFEATFPEEELERERNVVIEEIKRSKDNPGDVLFENFNNLLFKETPYKRKVIGKEEIIRDLSRDEIIDYYKKFYQPKNMILSICGDINIQELKNVIEEKFNKYKSDENFIIPVLNLQESKKPEIFEVKKHKVQHTYFLCGFLGPQINDRHQYTADVLSVILGEGISSRLYKIIREEKMLVYEIGSGFYTQVGSSIFYISGVCEQKNLEKTISEIKNILDDLKINGPKEEELNKAKQIITTRWYFSNETVHSKASSLAWWEMFKSLEELNMYLENINQVSYEDIKNFINLYADSIVSFALTP
ncbi:MAG: M16 family metallopeptidase [Endomicrobiia bacterium]